MKIYRLFKAYAGVPENRQPQIGWVIGADGQGWTFIPADKSKEAHWAPIYDDCLPWWSGGLDGTRAALALHSDMVADQAAAAGRGYKTTMASIVNAMKG